MNRFWNLPLESAPQIFMLAFGVHRPLRSWDRYRLPDLWCLHFYRYEGELRIDGESFPIHPGSCSVLPPGARLEYSYRNSPSIHAVAHFKLLGKAGVLSLPAMRELGKNFDELASLFEEAIPWRSTQPARAAARVWDVSWRLGNLDSTSDANTPPPSQSAAIERSRQYIEMNLSTPSRIERIAEYSGFSHNHFTRLFAAATGSTPATYIRRQRVARARHLLRNSTLPIKAIASQCGLGDLQAFNKTMRRELGHSPRELRQKK